MSNERMSDPEKAASPDEARGSFGEVMSDFEKVASLEHARGFFGEFWDFLRYNKKWWLLPILVMLLLFGVLAFLSGTSLAPFIYTLF